MRKYFEVCCRNGRAFKAEFSRLSKVGLVSAFRLISESVFLKTRRDLSIFLVGFEGI